MQCPRCQHENRPQATFCEKCASPIRADSPPARSYADLKTDVESLGRALSEALEQQTATAEILRAISSSPTDLRPVLETLVQAAARFCGAVNVALLRLDGGVLRVAAAAGPIGAEITRQFGSIEALEIPVTRDSVNGRAVAECRTVNIHDLAAEPESEFPVGRELQRQLGHHSAVATPLLREGVPIGALDLFRTEVQPFSDKQLALLQTFADQAVIAIENVRLFNETKEALEQQTATSEVLRIISSSPTDVQPVFDTIVRSALRLCSGATTAVFRLEGGMLHHPANYGGSPEALAAARARYPRPVGMDSIPGIAILTRSEYAVPDTEDPAAVEMSRETGRILGIRSLFAVPMLREGEAVGAIVVTRREPGRFAAPEVALLKTFADQAVIAIENVRLFTELQEKNRALTAAHAQVTEALEQQTATSEILKAISGAQIDAKPVFEAIARSAVKLCGAFACRVFRADGELFQVVGEDYGSPEGRALFQGMHPEAVGSDSPSATAARERRVVQYADVPNDPDVPQRYRERAGARGYRALMSVPMVRDHVVIGTIAVARQEPVEFSEQQVELIKTFADQAVIAIENVRLFKELEARNHDLSEALDRQTATADVLRIIAQSPTELQPVLDAIATSAVRLCAASDAVIERLEGDRFYNAAHAGAQMKSLVGLPLPLTRQFPGGRAILDRKRVIIDDIQLVAESEYPDTLELLKLNTVHSCAEIPLLSEGKPLGNLAVLRAEVRPFTDGEIALLETFASQAVIAIENARLFDELQARNRDLTTAHARVTEALERQTATSEILRVISSAHTDAQLVFDTIVQSAVRLCNAANAAVFLTDGTIVYEPANYGSSPELLAATRARYPRPLDMETTPGIAILTRSVVHTPDIEDPSAIEFLRQSGRLLGFRSVVTVPMLREGEAVGALIVARQEPGRFADAELELLKTFADQAVIAIENVRLFKELEARTAALTRSVEQLTALGEVGRAVSSTLDLETVLTTIVSRAVQLSGLDGGVVFEYDEGGQEFVQRAATETGGILADVRRATRIPRGEGVLGRTAITLEPVQVPDITVPGAYESRLRGNLIESGIRAILAVPMVRESRVIGCLAVTRNRAGVFPVETIEMLRTFATQSALAIQNARLYRELVQKSRELEAASQHKSEFLANMSHELRTPLNAVIGFSEVLIQRMFGELTEKQDEYLKDIYASGQHLLSLINDILDLSKIEAGRMELTSAAFYLPPALENAVTLVKERAARHGIGLKLDVDPRLGEFVGDERKVKQVLLNLLSNAVKFTPEGGRISLKAVLTEGSVEVSVSDTGIGIAPDDQAAIFEEFRQVGSDDTRKQEGTGLGLTLAKKFVELHGGRIWVESEVGRGSTFTFTLPLS